MTTTEDTPMRKSAREMFYEGSGQPAPSPTDEEIAAIIRKHCMGKVVPDARFDTAEDKAALKAAVAEIRALFPSTTTTKDTE
jgi:hypothetical protein